jgi:hypothetical protein
MLEQDVNKARKAVFEIHMAEHIRMILSQTRIDKKIFAQPKGLRLQQIGPLRGRNRNTKSSATSGRKKTL